MKKILALTIGLMTIGSFAQKKELKVIEKALSGKDYAGALTTLSSIEGLVNSGDDKYKSKFYFLKGKALAGQKKYSEAKRVFDQLFDFEKNTAKTHTSDAKNVIMSMAEEVNKEAVDLYSNKKDYKKAAEKFYLTYKLSPTDTIHVYNAAVSSSQAKDYNAALKCYKELRELGYTGVQTEYVATNKATGQVEDLGSKAQRDLMVKAGKYTKPETRTSENKQASIVKNIALILVEQGKTDEALTAMTDARKENPKDLSLILVEAGLYSELNKMDKFGELMNEAVALDPENPDLYYNLGVVNYEQGRVEDAKKYYKKAIELKPDYANAHMNLAIAILAKDQAIVEEMNKNLTNFKKYDQLALQQKGVYKEALPYLEKADSYNRTFETVRTLKGIYDVLEMKGKAAEYKALYDSLR